MAHLPALVGNITTPEQIARASEYSDPLAKGERNKVQKAAFDNYTIKHCHLGKVSAEMEIYKLIGESSAYFGLGEMDVPIIQELSYAVRDWIILEARGSPKVLVDGLSETSLPARLKEYMEIYKNQKEIRKWTEESLNSLRFTIAQALKDSMGQGASLQRVLDEDGKPQDTQLSFSERKRRTTY